MTLADEMRRRSHARPLLADQMREEMREDQAAQTQLNVARWLKLLWGLLFGVLCLFPWKAHAADVFCGVDTDFSGTASNPCPEPDKDHDGWASSNKVGPFGTGVDCDDTNFWIQPGFETASGCSAGNYRTCQTDGTYTSCAAISAFTCHTGSGHTFWVDDAETDCTGAGTYADPEDWRCWSNSGMSGYHAPVAGDCIVFQPGTYSSTWSDGGTTRQFYIDSKDGTAVNPIVFRGEPGAIPGYTGKVKIQGAGTSPTPVFPWFITGSDYTRTFGFEIDGTGGYNSTGIILDGSVDPQAYLNYIHDIDGIEDNNVSCIKCQVDDTGCYAHHNIVRDCYEVGAASDQNNMQIRSMDDLGTVRFMYNIIPNTVVVGGGMDCKHADDLATYVFQGNFIRNVAQYAIGSENKDNTVKNNWIKDCNDYAFKYKGIGDTNAWFKDSTFNYNTVQACALTSVSADWDDALAHQSYSGTTVSTTDHNIMADDNAAYDGDEGDGVARFCEYNCVSGEFAAATGKAIWTNNILYSSGTTDLRFGYFGQAGGGADYAGLAAWQAAGFDTGSVQADPSLDADGISATYPLHGWSVGIFTDATPTSTGTNNRGPKLFILRRNR